MIPGLDLITAPATYIIGIFRTPPQVEETTEQLQQTSLDDQDLTSPEMPQHSPDDHKGASGDDWSTASHKKGGRRGGPHRPVPGTGAHRHHGEHQLSKQDRLQSRFQEQSVRLGKLENDNLQLVHERESLEQRHLQLSGTHQNTVDSLRETQTTCQRQQEEIVALRRRLVSASTLLDVRNHELGVAKAFLSKEDRFSTSDVLQLVRDLNTEIMQTAAYLAETLPLKRFRTPSAGEVPEGPCKSTFVALVLPQGSGGVDEGLLELALRGFLIFCASWIANTWSFNYLPGWYDELYSKVCETGMLIRKSPHTTVSNPSSSEDRTVASNWRVLTRRTLSHGDSSHEDLPSKIVGGMVNQLAGLLSSCGVGNSVDNVNNIQRYAAEKLEALFTTSRKLNKMIGENIVSEDLVVNVIPEGTIFDGERMEDAYVRGGPKPSKRAVICTMDLGLCERKGTKGVGKVFLKPKVALRDR